MKKLIRRTLVPIVDPNIFNLSMIRPRAKTPTSIVLLTRLFNETAARRKRTPSIQNSSKNEKIIKGPKTGPTGPDRKNKQKQDSRQAKNSFDSGEEPAAATAAYL